MNRRYPLLLRFLSALAVVVALALPVAPAMAQTTNTTTSRITIDLPTAGATVRNGVAIDVGGWAVDSTGPGTGIDMVRVYLDSTMDNSAAQLGTARYGGYRPDVASSLGNPAFANSGFDYVWTPSGITAGSHTVYVYAHSTSSNRWAYQTSAINVSSEPPPAPPPPPSSYQPSDGGYYGQGPGYGPPYGDPCAIYPPDPACPYPPPYPPYNGGQPCILIYPPPPGCGGPPYVVPPPFPPAGGIYPPGTIGLPAPTNLTATAIAGRTVTLSWSLVPSAVSYRVYQSVAGAAYVPSAMSTQTTTSAVISGLNPMTTYTFVVVAMDAFGNQGPPSTALAVTTAAGP